VISDSMVVVVTWVGLLRNGGCVLKDLLDAQHALMRPKFGAVSLMEAFIAPLQLAAVVFNISIALPVLFRAAVPWLQASGPPSEAQWLAAISLAASTSKSSHAVFATLDVRATFAGARATFLMACCDLTIGCAFITLFLDSLHISLGVYIQWALVCMELALLYVLTVIAAGAIEERERAAGMHRLSLALQAGEVPLDSPAILPLALNATHVVTGKLPSELPTAPWKDGKLKQSDPLGTVAATEYVKELDDLQAALVKEIKANKTAVADELMVQAFRHRWQARLSWSVFVLNAIAFVGYAVFPVTFLAPSEKRLTSVIPFWPGNAAAEWIGNFAGDVAWTIEPFILLACPPLIAFTCNSAKAKSKVA